MWLTVMTLFPLSLLLLKFNRGRLLKRPRTGLSLIFATFAVAATVFAGNIVVDPVTAEYDSPLIVNFRLKHSCCFRRYFAIYFLSILFLFLITQNKARLLWYLYCAYDQNPVMHRWSVAEKWGEKFIKTIRSLKRQEIVILVATDEVSSQFLRHFEKLMVFVTLDQ